ncbi:NACHT, LRR and PYD domains-containing protein 3-like isoform X4 [Scyliorhinus canicula]|uniref:NACHT, LRR and PYD domains-containing protein 3-like isoform X4 n=1 Tax=Scyliorhinus canicula TaxID=7830 RepID=UPI0018F59E13|nr:NACHT, LRR and PYD domains-containing protein 3-like isoform X4 [Scyliorhinus canicula]
MCDNPSYCRIICYSLGPGLRQMQGAQTTLPTTVTQLFAAYLYNIFKNHEFNISKHHDLRAEQIRDVIIRTGQMGYMGIDHNITQFNEKQLNDFKLEQSHTLPGFLVEHPDPSQSIFTFIHMTLQEFIAAVAKYLTVDPQSLAQLLASAESNVRFRTFLRFMVGLASSGSDRILGEIVGQLPNQTRNTMIDWVKKQTENNLSNTQNNFTAQSKASKSKLLESLYYLFELQNTGLMQQTVGLGAALTLGHDFPYNAIRLMPMDCIVMASVLDHCYDVQELNLNNCCVGAEEIQRLVPVLHKFKVLSLGSNRISHTDFQQLTMALTNNSSLIQLYLNKNQVGDTGVRYLCEALNSFGCRIQTLELEGNGITDTYTEELAVIPLRNTSMTRVNLANNLLTDRSVCSLQTLIQRHTYLQEIGLQRNKFRPDGGLHLQSLSDLRPGLRVDVYSTIMSKGLGTSA